jgi:hypothetical protein
LEYDVYLAWGECCIISALFELWRLLHNRITCLTSEASLQARRPPHQLCSTFELELTMPRPHQPLLRSSEADIQLAILSIDKKQIQTERAAIQIYNIPRTTLRDRRAGKPTRRDCQPNLKKLTELEEVVIVRYILDLDQRGFAPMYAAVRDIANKLLAVRKAG